jgi:hypothetical protein
MEEIVAEVGTMAAVNGTPGLSDTHTAARRSVPRPIEPTTTLKLWYWAAALA